MPDLQRTWKWERYEPNLGPNREQERPFFFRVKSGLTVLEMEEYGRALSELLSGTPTPEDTAKFLSNYVEFGDEPLSVCGQPIADLTTYLTFIKGISGGGLLSELFAAVRYLNSVKGTQELFFARLSGGTAFTATPRTGRAANPTGGR